MAVISDLQSWLAARNAGEFSLMYSEEFSRRRLRAVQPSPERGSVSAMASQLPPRRILGRVRGKEVGSDR
jgi:hypothetical protein